MSSKWQSDIERVYGLNSIGATPDQSQTDARNTVPHDEQFNTELRTAQTHIASLFQNLRRVLDRPVSDLAIKLQTTSDVILSLENGRFDALPPWNETVRVVTAYTNLVDIDPGPALHVLQKSIPERREPSRSMDATIRPKTLYNEPPGNSIGNLPPTQQVPQSYNHFHAGSPPAPGSAIASNPASAASPVNSPSNVEPPVKWRKGISGVPIPAGQTPGQTLTYEESESPLAFTSAIGTRVSQMVGSFTKGLDREAINGLVPGSGTSSSIVKVGLVLGFFLLATAAALYSPLAARYAHAYLPGPLAQYVLSAHNALSPPKTYQQDGMKWIEAADPRSRRTDKILLLDE